MGQDLLARGQDRPRRTLDVDPRDHDVIVVDAHEVVEGHRRHRHGLGPLGVAVARQARHPTGASLAEAPPEQRVVEPAGDAEVDGAVGLRDCQVVVFDAGAAEAVGELVVHVGVGLERHAAGTGQLGLEPPAERRLVGSDLEADGRSELDAQVTERLLDALADQLPRQLAGAVREQLRQVEVAGVVGVRGCSGQCQTSRVGRAVGSHGTANPHQNCEFGPDLRVVRPRAG